MADAASRSLSACLRCRRLKVKCAGPSRIPCQRCKTSGADCRFVAPRAIAKAGSSADGPITLPTDQASNFSRLENEIAQLRGVIEGLRNDLTQSNVLQQQQQQPSTNASSEPEEINESWELHHSSMLVDPFANGSNNSSILQIQTQEDLVSKGILSEEECFELYETYSSKCNDTMAIFDSVTEPFGTLRKEPILLAAVCAIGARAAHNRTEDYRRCVVEANSLISTAVFGPTPSLPALIGVIIMSAWHRDDRLWGMAVTLAYEMGLPNEALRLPGEATRMSQEQIARARTWLSVCCIELMGKMHRPYIIESVQRFIPLAQHLLLSPYTRPVDQRIMAYLELFRTVVESREFPLNRLPILEQQNQLAAFNEALDVWFHRVHNSIDPLYQTFSKPQDRNRLVIPYAYVRLYVNCLVLDTNSLRGMLAPGSFTATALAASIEAAFLLLNTAFDSRDLTESLRYAIDYSSVSLNAAISFLSYIAIVRRHFGSLVNLSNILDVLKRALQVFKGAESNYHAEWLAGILRRIADTEMLG